MIILSNAKCCIIYGKPFPSPPNKCEAGTTTLSNEISAVSEAFHPNFSRLVDCIPLVFLSTTKMLIPLLPNSAFVLAATTK